MDTAGKFPSPDPATVIGELKRNRLTFVKKYISLHYVRQNELIVDDNQEGPPIYYEGLYDVRREAFIGKWDFQKKQSFWGLAERGSMLGRGTWEMVKEKMM